MPAIAIVFFLGLGLNVLATNPHSLQEASAALLIQLEHPVIVADYSKLNDKE